MLLTSFLLLLLTAIKSRIVYLLNNYWKKFGELLGKYISPIVLLFIYFAVIFPTKCLLVLFRKDILLLKINKNEDSYWIKRTNIKSSMDNQF